MAASSLVRTAQRRAIWLVVLLVVSAVFAEPRPYNFLSGWLEKKIGFGIGQITKPYVLGLDLQGGTHLEYEADVSKVPDADRREALNGVRDVIERRVNTLGVSEPLVQTLQAGSAWRVTVELAGIKDVNQAIKLIGDTPILEFKEENRDAKPALTAEQRQQLTDKNKMERARAEALLAEVRKNPNNFEELSRAQSDNIATKQTGGDLGFIANSQEYRDLFQVLQLASSGTIANAVIERTNAYVIAKAEEVKDVGPEIRLRHLFIAAPTLIDAEGKPRSHLAKSVTVEAQKKQRDDALTRIQDLRKRATPANFVSLLSEYSEDPKASSTQGLLDWAVKGDFADASIERVSLLLQKGALSEVVESQFGFHILQKVDERPKTDVRARIIDVKKTVEIDLVPNEPWRTTKLTGKQLTSARVDFDQQIGTPIVSLQFNDEGDKLFQDITRRNIGKRVGIFLDGRSISEPVVNTEIIGGRAVIQGSFSVQQAKLLARSLQAGALPVPITLVAQQTVGPTLGVDSLTSSVRASVYGFLLVALFMVLLYRLPGLVSIIALLLYAALLGSIFKLVPVTLTLAGVAGFILSLGIAVDANVLVYERLKEELLDGKSLVNALEESFKRAWPSIRDGHMTVLISCVVLYGFSSSIIRGFALILAIGTLLSLFTAVVSTRTFLRVLVHTPLARYEWWFLRRRS